MKTISVSTHKKDEVVDITETVHSALRDAPNAIGVCVVFAAHTTCALTTADLDPGTDQDLLDALRKLLPPARSIAHTRPYSIQHYRAIGDNSLCESQTAARHVAARDSGRTGWTKTKNCAYLVVLAINWAGRP